MRNDTMLLIRATLLLGVLLMTGCAETGGDDDASGARFPGTGGSATADSGATDGSPPGGSTDGGSADGGSTGELSGGDAPVATDTDDSSLTSEPFPDPEPPVDFQPGSLTAGDHDDQLNRGDYRRFADRFLDEVAALSSDAQSFPYLDLERAVTVDVRGTDGTPLGAARVRVMDGDREHLTLVAPADGTVHLYPGTDDLPPAFRLEIGDRLDDVRTSRDIVLDELADDRRVEVRLAATGIAETSLDLLLVIDTTGSMGDELEYLKAELGAILSALADANPTVDIRIGLVVYRDVGDEYVVRSSDFTADLDALQDELARQRHAGGGDYPEAMDRALAEALALGWREDSTKVLLLVADAPPHAAQVGATWSAAREARERRIHIVPVAASGVASEAEYLMRSMAALTESRYLFLTDDSGFGAPHEEPSIDCYVVTRLDGLIRRVLESLLTGERVEPADEEIVRRVGEYDAGRCLSDGQ